MTTYSSKIKLIITVSLLFHTLTLSIIPGTSTVEQYLNAIEALATPSTTTTTTTTTTTSTLIPETDVDYGTDTAESSTTSTTAAPTESSEETDYETETETDETELPEYGPAESTGPPVWQPVVGPYKLGGLITCLEQNNLSPFGFKEKLTYGNWDSESCAAYPELCDRYMDCDLDPVFCNEGDVCDHDDPLVFDEFGNRKIRDSCKMQTLFLEEIDDAKSWAYKCARHEICPVKNESEFYYDKNGVQQVAGTMGCMLSPKRVICCCQTDYCNGIDLYLQYAAFGSPENYPPDLQKLVNIDPGDTVVEYTEFPDWVVLPDWDCIRSGGCTLAPTPAPITGAPTTPMTTNSSSEEEDEGEGYGEEVEGDVVSARSGGKSKGLFMEYGNGRGYNGKEVVNSNDGMGVEDVIMIFGFFMIAILCCGIGVFIGTKMEENVAGGMKNNNQFVEYV